MRLLVIYEDNHLIVVNKPAGLATMGVSSHRPNLVHEVRGYLKRKYHKPGNVYVGVVSRLDAPVSGVVIFARTSKAAARLSAQFRARTPQKSYLAIVSGEVNPPSGELRDTLARDECVGGVRIVPPGTPGGLEAHLTYEVLGRPLPHGTAVRVSLYTGRKHQIRAQFAVRGWPILGDRRYGSPRPFSQGIALHAWSLTVLHPTRREPMTFIANLPPNWPALPCLG